MTTTTYLLFCYFAFAFTKFMLCVTTLPTAIAVMSRLNGAKKGRVFTRYAVTVPLFLAASSFFLWVYSMYVEGFGFFCQYSKRSVMKDCVRAHRKAHQGAQHVG